MLPQFLTENYPLEKHLFLVPKIALTKIGFYPESKLSIWLLIWAGFNFSILAYGCYAEFSYGVHHLSIDVMIALDALCPVASSIMSLVKIFFIWYYRTEFAALIARVRTLTAAECTPAKLHIKRKRFTLATRLTALVLFFASCTSTAYAVRSIIINVLRYMSGKELVYDLPFKMMLPNVLLSMPLFPITFVFVNWHGFITLFSFVGADGFFLGFCLYFTALLQSLQEDLKEVLGELEATAIPTSIDESLGANKKCEKLLAGIIERHNEIFELTRKFSKVVVGITLGHFLSSSMIIGMSCIAVLLYSGIGIAVYVVYTCAVTTEIFLYCYGGSSIVESSQAVGTTAYSSQWYTRNIAIQKMVLLIVARCQQPFMVKIPFFAPSLPVLASILRFTGSLIALANSIL